MLLPLTNPKACLILAHGAGAACDSPYMIALAEALGAHNIQAQRFNFRYMQQSIESGRKRPPEKMTLLQQEFLEQINIVNSGTPLFIGGKSMGGRVASMLNLLEVPKVRAIFAFGYPFHPPGKNSWRTEHFARLTAPLYIIQGERDPFGKRTELVGLSWPDVRIHWLATADHDFNPTKASKLQQQQLIDQAAAYCNEVIDEILLASQ